MIRKASSPAFEIFEDDVERRSFAFFKDRTLEEISGYFPSDFWERLVPLATFHEPALRHASVALASLHERFEKGDRNILKSNKDIAEGGFALQQYNKAIRYLINPPGDDRRPTLDTSLVACVLFACFETLRGHHGSALSHIRSGTQILNQVDEERGNGREESSRQLCVPLETLDVVFARLDQQVVQLSGARPMSLPKTKRNAHPGFGPDIPAAFHSLEEARNCLDYQWSLCVRSTVDFPYRKHMMEGTESQEHRDAFDVDRTHFRAVYNTWMAVFQNFLERNVAAMNSKSLQGAMVLKMQGQLAAMYQEMDTLQLLHDETGWDEVIPMLDNLVDLVAAVIDSQKATGKKLLHKPTFQLDQSTINPLFTVGHKCRDPILRRRAISMLYSPPRQEGVWDSILTARACERIMNLEEEGLGEVKCAADVPDWRRISDIEVSFDLQARRGKIKMSRLRSRHSNVREPVTDVFEW